MTKFMSSPAHLLELLAAVHALKKLRPYRLDKPFELHTDNASLRSRQRRRHVSHHQARWLNLLAEYQYRVVHIPGRTNTADFLTRKRFPDGTGLAPHTGYAEPSSCSQRPARLLRSRPAPEPPRFLRPLRRVAPLPARLFAAAIRAALPSDPALGPRAAAPQAQASSPGAVFEAPPAAASPSRLPRKGGRRAG